MRVHFNRYL
jgi:hypothetical protein